MKVSRRNAVLSTLFGAGAVGLRSLATGLPAAFFLDPRKAFADPACASAAKAQYIIFSTSQAGDPINANAPGTYTDPNIVHSSDPTMAPTTLTLRGKPFTAAKPWSTLPQAVLDRTVFWHIMTHTPVHPKETEVLQLMGATATAGNNEMLPSLLAKVVAPCLGTIQPQPISVGAVNTGGSVNPGEALTFNGATLPVIPPLALKDTLANPTGPLSQLQSLRDQGMSQIYAYYKNGATPAQKAYVDQLVTSQQQLRSINQSLLGALSSIKDNTAASQILAAVTLIQMKVAPVISIHLPFGGDNHNDPGLATEASYTVGGVASLASLMAQLQSTGLQDQVTVVSLNVFGRTIGPGTNNGRQHNLNHQVSLTIGPAFKGGMIGGCAPVQEDYGCTPIDSSSGAGVPSGDIQPVDTLAAFAQTTLAAVGADAAAVGQVQSATGKVVPAALA